MDLLLLLSRVLHILGAIILVGGLFYVTMIVSPAAGAGATPDALFGGRRAKWAMWIGIATALLLASGFFNYWQIIRMHEKLPGGYHAMAGIKILLGFALFFLAALLAGRTAAAEQLRRNARLWLHVCLVLGIAIVVLGAVLKAKPRTPKATGGNQPVASAASVRSLP
jgi:uncharacterized membrane protein